jgi:predicted transcriptional regulator
MADEMLQSPAGPDQLLGELEAAIMHIVWQRQEVSVREVLEALQPARPLKYTTVMTVMSRLAQKGVLATRKQGKSFYYHATVTPQEFVAQRAQRAVQSVLADFGDLAMTYFIQELGETDPQRLARLHEITRGVPDQEQQDAS